MIKRFAWILLALLVAGAAAVFAVGGRPGVLLLFVMYGLAKTYGPTQPVVWQPASHGEPMKS